LGQEKSQTQATRMSSVVLLIIFITLALALTALILAAQYSGNLFVAGWLALIGIAGIVLSIYVILQMRRHRSQPSVEVPPMMTTIECKKDGYKNVREFKRGDYIFKEAEPCPKCNEKMMITSIYREVKEKDKEKERSRV